MKISDMIKSFRATRGAIDGKIYGLVGALILILLITVLGPQMFDSVYSMNDTTTPAWVKATLFVVVGAGLVLLTWKAVAGGK